MACVNVPIHHISRNCQFPWPVHLLSHTENMEVPMRSNNYKNKFGVCIRSYSEREFAEDIIDGVRYRTRFPNVVLKFPDREHSFAISASRRTFEVIYSEKTMNNLLKALPFPEVPIWKTELSDRESRLIRELSEQMEHTMEYGVADLIDVQSFELTQSLLLNHNQKTEDPGHSRIMRIVSFFNVHYRESFDLETLLRQNGMSRSTFERHWRDRFGLPPGQYLLKLRLDDGCRMLREGYASISEIAEALGFSDANYFCALFRKRFEITPLQYRKRKPRPEPDAPSHNTISTP